VETWGEEVLKRRDVCIDSSSIDIEKIERPYLVGCDDSEIAIVGWVVYLYDFVFIKMAYCRLSYTSKEESMIEGFIKFVNTKAFVRASHAKAFLGCYYTVEFFFLVEL